MTKQPNYCGLPVGLLILFISFLLLVQSYIVANGLKEKTITVSSASSVEDISNFVSNPTSTTTPFSTSNTTTDEADYTLLVYMIGSDLELQHYSATEDLIEMRNSTIGNSSKLNIIIQTGGGGGRPEKSSSGIERFIDFTKVQRHQMVNGTLHTLMDLGVINMAEPSALSDFMKWGAVNFPARKYAIILWDHGSGLSGFGKDLLFDNSTLDPYELAEAFGDAKSEAGIHFELIGFDACLMSSLEIVSRLHNFADYMVSSQEVVPSWGFDYNGIIKSLVADPSQSGRSLGVAIADSFVTHSQKYSLPEQIGAHEYVTLSVIDMAKIPQLVNDVNILSKELKSEIRDYPAAVNVSKSISSTEEFGRTSQTSSGLIDLFDLTQNMQQRYPALSEYIEAVQNSSQNAVVYTHNGVKRPNAYGISVYLPLDDFRDTARKELFVVDVDWLNLLSAHKFMVASDNQPPIVKSAKEGAAIKSSVYGPDVSSIFAHIITNSSSKGYNLIYNQNLDPSIIDNSGFLNYKKYDMLVICNEDECIPTSINLEVNRDRKIAFIPVRYESYDRNINENMSLMYEITKQGELQFIGIRPETDPGETIPKDLSNLKKNDKIFVKAIPTNLWFQTVIDISSQKLRNPPTYIEDGPLVVKDPTKLTAHYVDMTSPFSISFTICDYSDNCGKTRWYIIRPGQENLTQLSPDAQSSFDLLAENKTDPTIVTDSDYNTYVNSQLGFKFKYPKDWETINQNIYVNSSDDFSSDPKVIELHPSKYVGIMGSLYRPSFEIEETYWPFQGVSPKYLFDLHNQTREQFAEQDYKMVDYGPVTIAGNPGFKFILEYVSEAERSLGLPEEKRTQVTVTTLINEHMYTLSFSSYSSQFGSYAPLVEDILNSFGPYPTLNAPLNQNQNSNTNITLGDGLSVSPTPDTNNLLIRNATDAQSEAIQQKLITRDNQNVTANIVFSTYTDEKYGFSIKYPSNVGLGKPLDLEAVNKTLIGINFDLDNSSIPSGSPDVTVAGFYPNETYLMSRLIGVTPSLPNHTNFSIDNILSIANQELSLFAMMPGFVSLENVTTKINNYPAHIVEYKYFNPEYRNTLQAMSVYLLHDDRLVILLYYSDPSEYYEHLTLFQEMVNSLHFESY